MNEQRNEQAVTRIFNTVFPYSTNQYDTFFGGTALFSFVSIDDQNKPVKIV